MANERLKQNQDLRPPEWWHDVIRKNLPGIQPSKYHFETFDEETTEGAHYIIQSFTKGCEAEGFPEGIFIIMGVPEKIKTQATQIALPIISNIKNVLKNNLEAKMTAEEKLERDPNPDFAGVLTITGRQYAIELSVIEMGSVETEDGKFSKFIMSLKPASEENLMNDIRNAIIEDYFLKMNRWGRIKFLANTNVRDVFRKAILKDEVKLIKEEIQMLQNIPPCFNESDLSNLKDDATFKALYTDLLDLAEKAKNEEDVQSIIRSYNAFSPLLKAGWLEFYLASWEKRLNTKL